MQEKTVEEHYDHLIEVKNDWSFDPPDIQAYMDRTDGETLLSSLGRLEGLSVLEVGIGTGRIAQKVLVRGCRFLTGLDLSTRALAKCKDNVRSFVNYQLIRGDICSFVRPDAFDISYSSLSLLHVNNKAEAICNMVMSTKPKGHIVLAIAKDSRDRLEFGDYFVRMYPERQSEYEESLVAAGAYIQARRPITDAWEFKGKRSETFGEEIATVLVARRL